MNPVYFPFTHIPDPIMRALNACFPQCSVYLPSKLHIPTAMQSWQHQERLHFRVPITGDESQLTALLNDYRQWAELHQDHQRSLLSQLQTQNAEIPFFDDNSTSHIKARLKQLTDSEESFGESGRVRSDLLHMSRVFYHGAYKPPREFNWVVGIILLLLTLLLSFTGYLLPWDQLALWAVTVGTNMAAYTPVFGEQVSFALIGGVQITADTLLRWYVLHVLFLPFIITIFMAVHFWRVRKDGGISGPL